MAKFRMEPLTESDKEIWIIEEGPEGTSLEIRINYDDVSHAVIKRKATELLQLLNGTRPKGRK